MPVLVGEQGRDGRGGHRSLVEVVAAADGPPLVEPALEPDPELPDVLVVLDDGLARHPRALLEVEPEAGEGGPLEPDRVGGQRPVLPAVGGAPAEAGREGDGGRDPGPTRGQAGRRRRIDLGVAGGDGGEGGVARVVDRHLVAVGEAREEQGAMRRRLAFADEIGGGLQRPVLIGQGPHRGLPGIADRRACLQPAQRTFYAVAIHVRLPSAS